MPVVVDASVVLVMVSGDPRREVARRLLRQWRDAGEQIHAPALLPYEVASGMARLVGAGALPRDRVAALWQQLQSLPITYHPIEDGAAVTDIALRLRRHSAYDAAYLALAARLGADLWAFDGPLARNAASVGLTVHIPA